MKLSRLVLLSVASSALNLATAFAAPGTQATTQKIDACKQSNAKSFRGYTDCVQALLDNRTPDMDVALLRTTYIKAIKELELRISLKYVAENAEKAVQDYREQECSSVEEETYSAAHQAVCNAILQRLAVQPEQQKFLKEQAKVLHQQVKEELVK